MIATLVAAGLHETVASRTRQRSRIHPSRYGLGALLGVALTLAGCASAGSDNTEGVEPIAAILASDISIEVDPSGAAATLTVDTKIPVACSVVRH